MAVIYYLNWDQEREEHGPASELFHKLNVESVLEEDEKPSDSFDRDEFEELYREVAAVDGDYSEDDLEQLWKEWNAGSRRESQEFYDAEVRSMSVGDVIEVDGTYYQAKAIGFEEISVQGDIE